MVVAIAVLAGSAVSGGLAWWLQGSRVEAKEQERAAAAAEVAGLAARVQTAEAAAATAAQRVQQADAATEAARKQVTEGTAQLDVARRDAAAARTERDEARSQFGAAKTELDRLRAADLDPGALPSLDLTRVFAGAGAKVRSQVDVQVVGAGVNDFDQAGLQKSLGAGLQAAGITAVGQSPFKVAVFVSLGKDQPRRSLGIMMLLLRNMKVPGEPGSREVAVWGQQRTSLVSDAEATGQARALLEELSRELGAAVLVKTPAAAAPTSPPPAAPPANGNP
ncbi:MAG: hypothetical protein EBQ99_07595 [Planctomycetes bacterium]|nr:hypothetical protein [Planctomycetota bacterium]